MSEGRSPTTTWREREELADKEIDALYGIVKEAERSPFVRVDPERALTTAYNNWFGGTKGHPCEEVLHQLLLPGTRGTNLLEKLEGVLRGQGIVLHIDSEATTEDGHGDHSENESYEYDDDKENDYLATPPSIKVAMQIAETYDSRVLLKNALEQWKLASENKRWQSRAHFEIEETDPDLLAEGDAYYEQRLKRNAFDQLVLVYRDRKADEAQADEMYERNLLGRTLQRVREEYGIHQIQAMDQERIKASILHKWVLAVREKKFVREQDQLVKAKALELMFRTYCQRMNKSRAAEKRLEEYQLEKNARLKCHCFNALTERHQQLQRAGEAADMFYGQNLTRSALVIWQGRVKASQEMEALADDAREYFLMKRHIEKWRSTALQRRSRRTVLTRWVLHRWRLWTKNSKQNKYQEGYQAVRRMVKMNLARRTLKEWRENHAAAQKSEIEAEEMYRQSLLTKFWQPAVNKMYSQSVAFQQAEGDADAFRDTKLRRKALKAWTTQHQALAAADQAADRFHELKDQDGQRQILHQWRNKSFQIQRREADAEAWQERRAREQMRRTLHAMANEARRRKALRTGQEPPLIIPPATPAQRRMTEMNERLVSTTPSYTPFVQRLRQETADASALKKSSGLIMEVEDQEEEESQVEDTQISEVKA